MIAASLLLLSGFGLFALGYVEPEMWSIAVVIIIVALIGLAVRSVDLVRWWLQQ